MNNQTTFDKRVAAYIKEIDTKDIPVVSRSHFTLASLYSEFGQDRVDLAVNAHFAAKRG